MGRRNIGGEKGMKVVVRTEEDGRLYVGILPREQRDERDNGIFADGAFV
jgi:hypothetical protein